jgi:DNA-binding PucR family transcriptional regulator
MNPVDDFLKTASFWSSLQEGLTGEAIGKAMAPAIVGAGFAAGGYGVSKAYGAVKERLTKTRDYKAMLDANPVLKKYDAGQVQMVYNSLRAQAPSLARDPLIANSFVNKTLELQPESGPHIDAQTVKMLTESQRNISQAARGRGEIMSAFTPGHLGPGKED